MENREDPKIAQDKRTETSAQEHLNFREVRQVLLLHSDRHRHPIHLKKFLYLEMLQIEMTSACCGFEIQHYRQSELQDQHRQSGLQEWEQAAQFLGSHGRQRKEFE